jgi:hypothetical protein
MMADLVRQHVGSRARRSPLYGHPGDRGGAAVIISSGRRPCSIDLEPRESEAAFPATVGKAERSQAADHSRRNLVNLALCQLPQGGFLLA